MASSLTTYNSPHVVAVPTCTVPHINWAGVRKKTVHPFLLLCRTLLYPHLECCTQLLSLSPERSGGARDGAKNNCKDHRAWQAETEGPRTPEAWRENAREDMTESYKSITQWIGWRTITRLVLQNSKGYLFQNTSTLHNHNLELAATGCCTGRQYEQTCKFRQIYGQQACKWVLKGWGIYTTSTDAYYPILTSTLSFCHCGKLFQRNYMGVAQQGISNVISQRQCGWWKKTTILLF